MQILIDECIDERIDERLRLLIPGYDCQTARFANFAGLNNGDLLDAANACGFDVPITVDQNMPDQQKLAGWKLALVILCAPANRQRDLAALGPVALSALESIAPGELVRIR